jgi:hypothetical protein
VPRKDLTRSLRVSRAPSGIVVRRNARGWQPRIPLRRITFATVLRETTCPASRRSAVIRGAPYVPFDASWNPVIDAVRTAALTCRSLSPPIGSAAATRWALSHA